MSQYGHILDLQLGVKCNVNSDCDGPSESHCCYNGNCTHAKFCLLGLKTLNEYCEAAYEC